MMVQKVHPEERTKKNKTRTKKNEKDEDGI
jgi:hypothetical protein